MTPIDRDGELRAEIWPSADPHSARMWWRWAIRGDVPTPFLDSWDHAPQGECRSRRAARRKASRALGRIKRWQAAGDREMEVIR